MAERMAKGDILDLGEEALELASSASRTFALLRKAHDTAIKVRLARMLEGLADAFDTVGQDADKKLEEDLRNPKKAELLEDMITAAMRSTSIAATKASAYVYANVLEGLDDEDKRMAWTAFSGLSERDVDFFLWLHERGFRQNKVDPARWSALMRDFRCEVTRDEVMEAGDVKEALGSWVLGRGEFTWRLGELVRRGLLLPDGRADSQAERTHWGYVIDHQTYDYWRLLKMARTGDLTLVGL